MSMLFFLLLLYTAIHPQLQFRSLANTRLKLIRGIERKRGWRVVTLIHRQEKIGFPGFPAYRYIDIEDSRP
jgi:ClpP class serine protease